MKPLQCALQFSALMASDCQLSPAYAAISSDHRVNGLPTCRCPLYGTQLNTTCDQRWSVRLTSSPAKVHLHARGCNDQGTRPKVAAVRWIVRAHRCKNSAQGSSCPVVNLKIRRTYLSIFLLAISKCSAIPLVIAQVQAPYKTVVLTTASNKRKRDPKLYSFSVSSRLKFWNLAHPAAIRLYSSVWWHAWKHSFQPKYRSESVSCKIENTFPPNHYTRTPKWKALPCHQFCLRRVELKTIFSRNLHETCLTSFGHPVLTARMRCSHLQTASSLMFRHRESAEYQIQVLSVEHLPFSKCPSSV